MMHAALFVTLIVGGTALLAWPLGRYMTWAMDPPLPAGGPDRWTRAFQRIGGAPARAAQDWK
jgi:potassium-transporting ATPase potassium-binding subunit